MRVKGTQGPSKYINKLGALSTKMLRFARRRDRENWWIQVGAQWPETPIRVEVNTFRQHYYLQETGRVSHNVKRGEFPNCFDCLSTFGGFGPKMQPGNKHAILERSPAPAALFSTASAGLLYSRRLPVRGWALVAVGRVRAGKVFANHEHKSPVPVGRGDQNACTGDSLQVCNRPRGPAPEPAEGCLAKRQESCR